VGAQRVPEIPEIFLLDKYLRVGHNGVILLDDIAAILDHQYIGLGEQAQAPEPHAEFEVFDSLDAETARVISAVVFEYHSNGELDMIVTLLQRLGFGRIECHQAY